MSAPGESPPAELPPSSKNPGGCLVALLVLIGIALVLPGICSLLFMMPWYSAGHRCAAGSWSG
jgi:hypothetical protein